MSLHYLVLVHSTNLCTNAISECSTCLVSSPFRSSSPPWWATLPHRYRSLPAQRPCLTHMCMPCGPGDVGTRDVNIVAQEKDSSGTRSQHVRRPVSGLARSRKEEPMARTVRHVCRSTGGCRVTVNLLHPDSFHATSEYAGCLAGVEQSRP